MLSSVNRIIHITPSYKPAFIYGGTTLSISLLCEAQRKNGEQSLVFTTTANGKEELPVSGRLPLKVARVPVWYFRRLTGDHSHFSPGLLLKLYQSIHKKKPGTIVHIHAWWNLTSILSCIIALICNIPCLLSPRGMLTGYTFSNRHNLTKRIIHQLLGKYLLLRCHLHATTDKEKNDILSILPRARVTVIPNLVGNSNGMCKSVDTGNFDMLFLSRIEEKKGLDILFKALPALRFRWTLTIAGTGNNSYLKKLQILADQSGLGTHINWAGQVSGPTKQKLLSESHLLVLFSLNENFANIITESLSNGLPVAISDQVGLAEYIKKENLGWVCPPEQKAIVSILTQAFNSHRQRMRISREAPHKIQHDFSSAFLLPRYARLYQSLQPQTLFLIK